MKAPHLLRGQLAERHACGWLRRHGLRPVTRNFHSRYGELDLVMLDVACLVIVEVRLRSATRFGDGFASVTAAKQRKVARTTQEFMRRHPEHAQRELRFDVIAVSWRGGHLHCDWRPNAFSIDEEF